MKKPDAKAKAAIKKDGFSDLDFRKRYPKLTEYLITSRWEDGSARELSSIAISVHDGLVQVAVNDKELKQSLYSTAGTLPEALQLAEDAIKDDLGAWRPWKSGRGR